MAEDRDDRTQEIALDEVDAARPRSGPPPLPSRRTPSPDLEPESSDRPTDPPPKSPSASKPPVRLGKSLVPPPLAAAVAPGRAETPRSSRATMKLKPITDVPSSETRVPEVRPEPLPFAQAEAARLVDAPTTPRPSVPPPLAGGVPPRVDRSTRELRRVGPSDASAPTTTATSATAAPTPSTTTPSTTTPSATTPNATTPSATTPSTTTPSATTPSASMPTSGASMPTPSTTPRALAAPRPALVSRPPTERPADRTTTASLADAALQARLRHLETHVDELPKWTARIAALESDPRFATLDARLETLGASLAGLHAKLDATVATLASLLERTSGLERARDEGRARTDRALDVATAALEASRGLDVRARETTERVRALDDALRALEAGITSGESRSKQAGGTSSDSNATQLALEERLATLERASDATLRTRVEAMEARLVSLVARFADIAARAPGEGGGRASLLPPAPPAPTPLTLAPTSPSSAELEALVRELVRRELADHEPPRDEPRAKPKKRRAPEAEASDVDPLTTVKGVGPAFAERLRANEVSDVTILAQLDDARLDALARAIGAPIAKLRKWREAARAMI